MGHTRIHAVALLMFFPAGIGVLAVQTSPKCERFVKNYVTVPVRNRVSKATALAWAKWRVAHPNWKPKPGTNRPKYTMSRKETMDKVALACEVPTLPATIDLLFTPADLDGPPVIDVPMMETAEVRAPVLFPPATPDVVGTPPVAGPPDTPDIPDTPGTPVIYIPPFVPPVFGGGTPGTPPVVVVPPPVVVVPPPSVVPTPEPASFVLVGLGMGAMGIFWRKRFSQTHA